MPTRRNVAFAIEGYEAASVDVPPKYWGSFWAEELDNIPHLRNSQKYYASIAIMIADILPVNPGESQFNWLKRAMKKPKICEGLEILAPFPERFISGGFEEFGGPNRARSVFTLIRSIAGPVAPRTGSYEWVWDILSKLHVVSPPEIDVWAPIRGLLSVKPSSPSYPPPAGCKCCCGFDREVDILLNGDHHLSTTPITTAVAEDDHHHSPS